MQLSSLNSEIVDKLTSQSQEAIKVLIQSAELVRRHDNAKSINFFDSFFKAAKKHII